MHIVFTESAWADYLYWQQHDKAIVKKINALIADIKKNPISGLGKPEPLKYQLKGYYSRRINQKDRLVYQVTEKNILQIVSVRFHYEE